MAFSMYVGNQYSEKVILHAGIRLSVKAVYDKIWARFVYNSNSTGVFCAGFFVVCDIVATSFWNIETRML